MNQKRQRGYYWLTDALLTCPSKKLEILQANPDLLDAGLVRAMLEVVEMREQDGDRNSANWLRNLATQIATGMGSSLSTLLREAEADELLRQGVDLQRTSQFKASLQFLQPALNIYRGIGNQQGEGAALNVLGNACDFFGQYQEAMNYPAASGRGIRIKKDSIAHLGAVSNIHSPDFARTGQSSPHPHVCPPSLQSIHRSKTLRPTIAVSLADTV
jgi:tetratricopeptide (TPR) repeat protein